MKEMEEVAKRPIEEDGVVEIPKMLSQCGRNSIISGPRWVATSREGGAAAAREGRPGSRVRFWYSLVVEE